MLPEYLELLHEDRRTESNEDKTHFCSFLSRTYPNSRIVNVCCCRLLLTKTHSVSHVQCLTAQHIYCTSIGQTVQPDNEVYLQELHRSCCYLISCTTGKKMSIGYLLKWNAAGGLKLYVYI